MQILIHAHSGLRWLVLISILYAIINSIGKTKGTVPYTGKDKKAALFALIFTHIQLVVGVILYFISPKVIFSGSSMGEPALRFYLVEHSVMMVIAIALITIGYSKAKRLTDDGKKFKTILTFYAIGLLIMLISIPWPFRHLGGSWF
ncbi:cytochrome B [Fulvivirga maritima]|uniref:cytochrome B n=1 Tax=Fulvivirga maritima TaxID=2904247 RepID=UPI001F1B8124|nr:cytochrome B [Fulvivirga maritima]UII29141.1 cytochrome B [Fulvivirga maritima]